MKKLNRILKHRIITVVVAMMAATTQSFAQQADTEKKPDSKPEREYCPSEISIWGAGGLSTLRYTPESGNRNNRAGGAFGLGYSYYWNKHFGFLFGAELALYQSKFTTDGLQDNYNTVDLDVYGNPEKINFRYRLNNYKESQQLWNVNIPLMLQFQTGRKYILYAAVGGKVGFPVKGAVGMKKHDLTTTGYFPREGRTYDDLPQFGLGTFEYLKRSADLDQLKRHYLLSAEAGLKWKVLKDNGLYSGVFVDYGLNNMLSVNDKTFVISTLDSEKLVVSPLVESQISERGRPFTNSIRPLAVGLKLRFTFLR